MDGVENGEPIYAVGNKKPPKHSQFVKGKSGNPSGKRKDSGNLLVEAMKELNKTARIKVNGKPRKMTNLQIIAAQIVDAAKNKDFRAIKLLMHMRQVAIAQDLISPKTGQPDEGEEDISKFVWTDEREALFREIEDEDRLQERSMELFKIIGDFCKRAKCGGDVDAALRELKEIHRPMDIHFDN